MSGRVSFVRVTPDKPSRNATARSGVSLHAERSLLPKIPGLAIAKAMTSPGMTSEIGN
jgi:hypothetical protein